VENIEERMNRLGINLADYYEREFAFIDCYSATCGKSNERWFCLTSMSNLEDLSLGIAQTSRRLGPPVRILFDSLSTLYLHNSIPTMASFFQIVVRRIKSEYGFSLHTVEKGMHDTQTEATLYHLVDGGLEMKYDENRESYFRVHHMKGKPALRPKWIKINFEENGKMALSEELF
jgi:KaiC/GvpD/RAD55 family RecA-like ATPase